MLSVRVIPSLLLSDRGLVKTVQFKNPIYVGDPKNVIKIFNDKEVDELIVIDIKASKKKDELDFNFLNEINREAFMPMAYGGGIKKLSDIEKIISLGYEKVIINSIALSDSNFITRAAALCGSQSVVVCMDIKKDIFGKYRVYNHLKRKFEKISTVDWALVIESKGAGEIVIYSVDNDGTFKGYDIELLKQITPKVNVPVVALGGAGSIMDFKKAINEGKASAISAGSMFVFRRPHKAVLISYPDKKVLSDIFD